MARTCCAASARPLESVLEYKGQKYEATKKFVIGYLQCVKIFACSDEKLPNMVITSNGRKIGTIVMDWLSNCEQRCTLRVFKGDSTHKDNLMCVVSERNCTMLTCMLGEDFSYLFPAHYYFNCCFSRKAEALLCCFCLSRRSFQTGDPYTACNRDCLCDKCFYDCDERPGVQKDSSTDSLCWHTSRHTVWDNKYQCFCNEEGSRVHEPAVWKEFNGCCNHEYQVNRFRMVLPQDDADSQALFIFAVQMLDLTVHKRSCGGCYSCTGPYIF